MSWISAVGGWFRDLMKTGLAPVKTPAEIAIARGLALWNEDIADAAEKDMSTRGKRGKERIQEIIRAMGPTWSKTVYRGDLSFAWCGAFVAWCWAAVDVDVRDKHFGSTYRLWEWWRSDRSLRVDPKDIKPGDIVVVGELPGKVWGKHIVLATSEIDDALTFTTLEGNAWGEGPASRYMQGVVKKTHKLDEVRFAYRPSAHYLKEK